MKLGHLSEAQEVVLSKIAALVIDGSSTAGMDDAVQRYVTRFVALQVENIPAYLRLPYLLAITGFQWLPLLRWGRPFTHLPEKAQRDYLKLWSDGPVGVTRDFVRLIRGCALLAYFDHPQTRLALEPGRGVEDAGRDLPRAAVR